MHFKLHLHRFIKVGCFNYIYISFIFYYETSFRNASQEIWQFCTVIHNYIQSLNHLWLGYGWMKKLIKLNLKIYCTHILSISVYMFKKLIAILLPRILWTPAIGFQINGTRDIF